MTSLISGSLLSLTDPASVQQTKAQHGRELLRGLHYYTYHSADALAPQIEQDENLSLTTPLPSKKSHPQQQLAKSFLYESKSVLAFLTGSSNISLLFNQTELCEDVIPQDVMTEIMPSSSSQSYSVEDFTIVQGRFLVILIQSGSRKSGTEASFQQKLAIFDCTHVSNRQSNHVRFLHIVEIEPNVSNTAVEETTQIGFNRVEAIGDAVPRSVLLIGKNATYPQHGPAPLIIQFTEFECERQETLTEAPFPLNSTEMAAASGQKPIAILDVCLWDNKVAFLYELKNTVAIYELTSLTLIFKASFKEANEQITSFYHINMKNDQNIGFFVLLETKTQTKKLQATGQTESKKVTQKIHLVELQQKEVRTSRKNIVQSRIDMFEQVDALSFGAENQKIADFTMTTDTKNNADFWLFLLNKRVSVSKKSMRVFTIKICSKRRKNKNIVYFDYITESVPKVSEAKFLDKKPAYFKVIPVTEQEDIDFYTYIGFSSAQHSAVFKFSSTDISSPPMDQDESSEADPSQEEEELLKEKKQISQASPPSSLQVSQEAPTSPKATTHSKEYLMNSQSPGMNKQIEDILHREISQLQAQSVVPTQQPSSQPSQPSHKQKLSPGQKNNENNSTSPRPQSKQKTSDLTDPAIISTKKGKKDKAAQPVVMYKEKNNNSNTKQNKTSPRDQEKILLDNFIDLSNKYKEMHEKLNQLTNQVKTQKDLQINVEQTVKNAVKSAMPELIKKQVEETVEPLIIKQKDIIQSQINSVILPRIEQQLRQGQAFHSSDAPSQQMAQESSSGMVQGLNSDTVRKIVQNEFRDAMANQIVPELEKSLRNTLSQIRDPLNRMNSALFEQLVQAENRSDQVVRRLEWQLNQQLQSLNNMQHQQNQLQQQQQMQQQQNFSGIGTNAFNNFNVNASPQQQQQQPQMQYFPMAPMNQAQFQPGNNVGNFYPNTNMNTSAVQQNSNSNLQTSTNPQQVFTPVSNQQNMQSAQNKSSSSPAPGQQVKFYPTTGPQTFNVSQPNEVANATADTVNFTTAFTVQDQTTSSPHMTAQQVSPNMQAQVSPQLQTQRIQEDLGEQQTTVQQTQEEDQNKEEINE